MNKVLNILTIFYGSLLLSSGVLKCFGLLGEVTLNLNGTYVTIRNPEFMLWIIGVNFIGGLSMLLHAILTFNYKRIKVKEPDNILGEEEKVAYGLQPLGCLVVAAGIIAILVAFFMLIRAFMMLGLFENADSDFMPLMLILVLYYVPFALVPGLLVIKNIFLSNEVSEKLKQQERIQRYNEKYNS